MAPPPPAPKAQPKKKQSGRPDPFIGSRDVTGLNSHNFDEFLGDKDVALVMFYDPADPQCEWSKKHFLKAAKTTVRENSAFAAVDCIREGELCENEGITSHPFFKLYSRGKLVGNYNNPQQFIYHTMKKFVENSPVLTEPQRPKRPC